MYATISCMESMRIKMPCRSCDGAGFNYVNNGAWIREKREKVGISLRNAAKKLEISASFLSDIELGKRNASYRVMNFFENL